MGGWATAGRAIERGGAPYRTVKETSEAEKKGDIPSGYILVAEAALQNRDYIALPPAFNRYLEERHPLPEGVEERQDPSSLRSKGKPVNLFFSCYRFTVPTGDVGELKRELSGQRVHECVSKRVSLLLNIGRTRTADLDWLRKLVRKGRRG